MLIFCVLRRRIFDSVGISYRNEILQAAGFFDTIFEVIFKNVQNVPKNTSANILGHDSTHRGVRDDIPLPYLLFDRGPKHVLQPPFWTFLEIQFVNANVLSASCCTQIGCFLTGRVSCVCA